MHDLEPITLLIVDDAREDRDGLRGIFAQDSIFQIVGEAANGRDAIRLARELEPRLITMDLTMPEVGGLEAIERIMAESPTRILVVTGAGALDRMAGNFEAISRGALDVVAKPWPWPGSATEQDDLRMLGRRLATVPVLTHVMGARKERAAARAAGKARVSRAEATVTGPGLIVIGASTGGPAVLRNILEGLPADLSAPVVIVQHLGEDFAEGFVAWLDSHSHLRVEEAGPAVRLIPGHVVVGVRGPHVTVTRGAAIRLVDEPPLGGHRPAIDLLFESAAEAYGATAIGVLLTGMGADGAAGLKAIADAGGSTVVQNESSSAVFGMPKAAVELGAAGRIVSAEEIPAVLKAELSGNAWRLRRREP